MEIFDERLFERSVKKIIKSVENSRHDNAEELEEAIEDYMETLPRDIVYLASLVDYLNNKGIDESKIDPRDVMIVDGFSTLDFLAGKATIMLEDYCLEKMRK